MSMIFDMENESKYSAQQRVDRWMKALLHLPPDAEIDLHEFRFNRKKSASMHTSIIIHLAEKRPFTVTIRKPVDQISQKDIKRLRLLFRWRKYPILARILRFFGWWFAFAGVYAMAGVCPFCGQVGCPVGATGAGVVGGLMAVFMQNWRGFIRRLKDFSVKIFHSL